MILAKPAQLRHVPAREHILPVVHGAFFVAYGNVGISFVAVPQKRRRVLLRPVKIEPVIENYQIGRILSAFAQHFFKKLRFVFPQSAADGVYLEFGKTVVATKAHNVFVSVPLLLGSAAETVGTAPETEADTALGGCLNDLPPAVGIGLFEMLAVR